MAVTKDKAAPYAPASAVIDLITRHRTRGLPSPVTAEVLVRAGVSDSLISRTLQALQTLDLVDESGNPTEVFESIRLAPESEYKQRLKDWLNEAYGDVISFVDPAVDDEVKVRDAFRSYKPVGQQARMVSLFMGLYAAAGVMTEKAAPSRQPRVSRPVQRARVPPTTKHAANRNTPVSGDVLGVPAPIAGMLSKLPAEGEGWTKIKRDMFLNTFGSVLDFCFPIVEVDETETASSDEDEAE